MELEFLSCSLAKLFFLFFLCSSFSRPTRPKSKTNLRNKPTKTHGKRRRRKERRRIRTWNKPTNTHQTQIKNNPMNKSTKTYSRRRRRKRRRRKRSRRTLTLGTNIQTPIEETIHINSKLISLAWSLHHCRCFSGLLLCYFCFFVVFVFVFFGLLRSLAKLSL